MPVAHGSGADGEAAGDAELKRGEIRPLLAVLILGLGTALALFVTCLWLHRRQRKAAAGKEDGLLVSSAWPRWIRYVISLFMVCFTVTPFVVALMSMGFAELYQIAEGWPRRVAFEYVLSSVASMTVPLTDVSPTTMEGDILDILIGILQFVVMSAVTGLVASMALITMAANTISPTWGGLMRYSFVYSPLLIAILLLASGKLLALVEGWHHKEGLLYMASCILGTASPLTEVVPTTEIGRMIEVLSMIADIGVSGAIIGIIGMHPKVVQLLKLLEGEPQLDDDGGADKQDAPPEEEGLAALGSCCIFEDAEEEKAPRKTPYKPAKQPLEVDRGLPFGGQPLVQQFESLHCRELAVLLQQEAEELRHCETMVAQHRWRVNHLWSELQQAAAQERSGTPGTSLWDIINNGSLPPAAAYSPQRGRMGYDRNQSTWSMQREPSDDSSSWW